MKIFIWKSYGEITVYDISTKEKYEEIMKRVKLFLKSKSFDAYPCATLMDCVWSVGISTDSGIFEQGTTIGVLND